MAPLKWLISPQMMIFNRTLWKFLHKLFWSFKICHCTRFLLIVASRMCSLFVAKSTSANVPKWKWGWGWGVGWVVKPIWQCQDFESAWSSYPSLTRRRGLKFYHGLGLWCLELPGVEVLDSGGVRSPARQHWRPTWAANLVKHRFVGQFVIVRWNYFSPS